MILFECKNRKASARIKPVLIVDFEAVENAAEVRL